MTILTLAMPRVTIADHSCDYTSLCGTLPPIPFNAKYSVLIFSAMEDYDKQIEILSKTRGMLQLVHESTTKIYQDLKDMSENQRQLNHGAQTTTKLLDKV